jgi:hypothetical protein
MKKKCVRCDCPSISGLKKGQGLCAYHWAEAMWGKAYADKCHPEHANQHKKK